MQATIQISNRLSDEETSMRIKKLVSAFVALVVLSFGCLIAPKSDAAPASSQTLGGQAQKVFDDSLIRYGAGTGTIDEVVHWSERIYEADHAQSAFVVRATTVEAQAQAKVSAGLASRHDALVATYHIAEAQLAK
jgi:hypothetical protein